MNTVCDTHIICFGNPLHGDDGFGSAVFDRLKGENLPSNVRLFDGGTSSLSALNLFDHCKRAIVIDAVQSSRQVGSLAWDDEESFKIGQMTDEMSSHGLGVASILKGLDILHEDGSHKPDVDILTCSIDLPTTFKMELSPSIESVITDAVSEILQKLKQGDHDL